MKIGTLNIDWFKKSLELKKVIQQKIKEQDLDFLIVNENILNFNFDENYFRYHSKSIPVKEEFQHLNYGIYLKGETPVRTSIYSKHKSVQEIRTIDPFTSICHKFIVDDREIIIYGTIIGTWGIKQQDEIAAVELDNFKKDIQNILLNNEYVFIVGDFNTSFFKSENRQLATIKSREEIVTFTDNLNIHRTTETIEHCIDHIFVSHKIKNQAQVKTSTFLENNILRDNPHKGISVELNYNS